MLTFAHEITHVDDYMKARLKAANALPGGCASIKTIQKCMYSDAPIMAVDFVLVNGHSRAYAILKLKVQSIG